MRVNLCCHESGIVIEDVGVFPKAFGVSVRENFVFVIARRDLKQESTVGQGNPSALICA